MVPHIFYLFKQNHTHLIFTTFFQTYSKEPNDQRIPALEYLLFFLPVCPSIPHFLPKKAKNSPPCELQSDARLPAAMGICRRQPGSLATGCSYLRLVQAECSTGLGFPCCGGSSRMKASCAQRAECTKGCGCIHTSVLLWLFPSRACSLLMWT